MVRCRLTRQGRERLLLDTRGIAHPGRPGCYPGESAYRLDGTGGGGSVPGASVREVDRRGSGYAWRREPGYWLRVRRVFFLDRHRHRPGIGCRPCSCHLCRHLERSRRPANTPGESARDGNAPPCLRSAALPDPSPFEPPLGWQYLLATHGGGGCGRSGSMPQRPPGDRSYILSLWRSYIASPAGGRAFKSASCYRTLLCHSCDLAHRGRGSRRTCVIHSVGRRGDVRSGFCSGPQQPQANSVEPSTRG